MKDRSGAIRDAQLRATVFNAEQMRQEAARDLRAAARIRRGGDDGAAAGGVVARRPRNPAPRCDRCRAPATHGVQLTVSLRRHVKIAKTARVTSVDVIAYSCSGTCLALARQMAATREGVRNEVWHYHYEVLDLARIEALQA